jgi:hypothetical protein
MFNGKIIKKLLENNNQSYDDLSDYLYGPNGGNISYLVARKSIRTDTLEKLADFFSVPTDVFFDRPVAGTGSSSVVGNNNNVGNIHINENTLRLENKMLKQNLLDKERIIEAKEKEIEYLKRINDMAISAAKSGQ